MKVPIVLSACVLLLLVLTQPIIPDSSTARLTKAVWVTRWAFKTESDVRHLLGRLEALGINTVFFQVRGSCDALYRSVYEPWSALLSGTLGQDPGWDPLEVAIEEGHRLGMEVHAWINIFPAWPVSDQGSPPPPTPLSHVMKLHPNWLAVDRQGQPMPLQRSEAGHNYAFLSPTHPSVQDYTETVVRDLVEHYEIDGLHLDYVRFPDSSYSYDSRSKAAYYRALRDTHITYADWRRDNLTEFVGRLAGAARRIKPEIIVSAAVWQKIDAGRDNYLQDGIEWARRGYVDFLVPMIYTTSVEAFETRLEAYADLAGQAKVVAGIGPYLESFTDSILGAQLRAAERSGVRGISVFNSDYALIYASLVTAYSAVESRQ